MGDNRASIDISFEAHGMKLTKSFNINYHPDECYGVDRRVAEWFCESWDKMMLSYYGQVAEAERMAQERSERELYDRLKAKYDGRAVTGGSKNAEGSIGSVEERDSSSPSVVLDQALYKPGYFRAIEPGE